MISPTIDLQVKFPVVDEQLSALPPERLVIR